MFKHYGIHALFSILLRSCPRLFAPIEYLLPPVNLILAQSGQLLFEWATVDKCTQYLIGLNDAKGVWGVTQALPTPCNKRTAFVATELYLVLNGYELVTNDADCVLTMLAVASGDLSEPDFATWIRKNTQLCTP